jgi:hypothetical protein
MSPKRTFLDSGVLIAAARGSDDAALEALQIIDDPDRQFVSSILIELEVFQKPFTMDSKKRRHFIKAFSKMMYIFGSALTMG